MYEQKIIFLLMRCKQNRRTRPIPLSGGEDVGAPLERQEKADEEFIGGSCRSLASPGRATQQFMAASFEALVSKVCVPGLSGGADTTHDPRCSEQ